MSRRNPKVLEGATLTIHRVATMPSSLVVCVTSTKTIVLRSLTHSLARQNDAGNWAALSTLQCMVGDNVNPQKRANFYRFIESEGGKHVDGRIMSPQEYLELCAALTANARHRLRAA